MTEPTVRVSGLTKAFENLVAVDHVDAQVDRGEILGLVGINGAGKTTFLRMLSGILPPTEGWISIAGERLSGDAVEARRQLAFVPDTPMLFEALTVQEHLVFVARLYRVEDAEARMEQVLERFELRARRNDPASSLSRGMRQKLAICCAFLHEPAALFLDEPLTGLDPPGRRHMCDAILARANAGSAVIISSHQLEFVERLSTRLMIIHKGRVRASGTLQEIRAALGRDEGDLEEIFLSATDSPGETL